MREELIRNSIIGCDKQVDQQDIEICRMCIQNVAENKTVICIPKKQ